MMEKISQQIRDDIEKKLAGQHKLSKKEEEAYDALRGKLMTIKNNKY